MKTIVRPIMEEEIEELEKLFSEDEQEWKRKVTIQYHRQKELVIGAFDNNSGEIRAVVVASGQGDTVVIKNLLIRDESLGELKKMLLLAEEKAARHYGYLQICLTATREEKNFLLSLGYKPRLTFTFSDKRREAFETLSGLYPMWIEAGGQQVKVILGGDHLDEEIRGRLDNLPITCELLFVKSL